MTEFPTFQKHIINVEVWSVNRHNQGNLDWEMVVMGYFNYLHRNLSFPVDDLERELLDLSDYNFYSSWFYSTHEGMLLSPM